MGKAIFGGISIAFMFLSLLSCGDTMVAIVDDRSDWKDDIERDKRELMAPRNPRINTEKKPYDQWEDIYVYN